MSSWYIVVIDHTLERFNNLKKEPIKRGDLLLCKPAKNSKGKLSTKIGYYNYEFKEDIVLKLTDDDFQWLLPIPFASTRYEMLTEKQKVWDQRHKINRGTLLRVYNQKLERVLDARVREIVKPEKMGKRILVKLDLHGDDNIYNITIGEVIEICEEHESPGNDKCFRINDRVVSSFNGKHGYIEAFVDGEASQASAKVIYDDQPSEIVSLELLIYEHDYDCGRQAESELNQAAATATIGKRRTCINVEMHRREIIHHWWDLIRSPKTHDALKLFLEQFSYLIIDDTLKRKNQVGNERARAFLVVLLGLTDYSYRSVLEHYERNAFDVFRHLSSFDEESPLNLQSSRENHRMAQQSGLKSLCRNLQKTFDSELNVDDIADKMIQSDHLTIEQAKDYMKLNLSKDRVNFILTHIEGSIPSTLAVFLQILETDYRQLYDKIKEASDKEGHVWRAVLKANRKNIVDTIHPKIRTILFALNNQDIITKEEHERITSHYLYQEMSSCFIDVLIDKQFPVPSNVFEILKGEGLGELAKKLHKDKLAYKEDEKGRVNSNWQNILDNKRQEIAANLKNTEKICELLQKSGILKKDQRKLIQEVSSPEQQGHYLIDEVKLMAYDGRKGFLEALQRTGNEHVCDYLAHQELLFEKLPTKVKPSAPDERGTKWIKLLNDTTIWIAETMKETPNVLDFLYRKGIITISQRKEIEKYPEKQQAFDIIDEVKKMALRGREEFLSALEATGNSQIYEVLTKLEKLKKEEYSQGISGITNKAEETPQEETSGYNPFCILGRIWSGSGQASGGSPVSKDDGSSTDPPTGANAMNWEESTDLEKALKRSEESYKKDENKRQRRTERSKRNNNSLEPSEGEKIIQPESTYEQPKCMPKVEASTSTTDGINNNVDLLNRETKQKAPGEVEGSDKSECNANIANIEYPKEVADHLVPGNLVRGSKVKMHLKGSTEYGSIKWIGYPKAGKSLMVGLEMENNVGNSDGMIKEKRLFKTSTEKGIFTKYEHCEPDDRYPSHIQENNMEYEKKPPREVIELVPPAKFKKDYAGRERGIVGRDNSCYLDSTLFCMFAFNDTFDHLLDTDESLPDNERDIVDHLKANIINPLRSKFRVESESMMHLRTMLDNLNIVKGLRGDQKDPEEVLKALFQKALNVQELYQMTNGTGDYFVQIFGSRDENLIPTTQKLLNSTFLLNGIKLSQAPECLIIQLPRYGKENKIYDKIFPTPVLHMDEIVQNALRFCMFCGNNAEIECKDCAGMFSIEDCVVPAYCNRCSEIRHSSPQRENHKLITLPEEAVPVEQFELFGVLCIETSHYVAFAKTGKEENAPWVFFDSMADRVEELSGYAYNIPEVKVCKHLQNFLYEDGLSELHTVKLSGEDHRFFSHSSVCFYRKMKP